MNKLEKSITNLYSDESKSFIENISPLLNRTLRNYQIDGVNWILQRFSKDHGCILGDEMGLGKTCQTINVLLTLKQMSDIKLSLILCPLSVLNNWKTEIKDLCPTDFKMFCYVGDKNERKNLLSQYLSNKNKYNVFLTTFEIFMKDYAQFTSSNFTSFQILVVDEAHRLKNKDTQLYQMLFPIGKFKLLLTGTPIQNNLTEFYNLVSFVAPNIFTKTLLDSFLDTFADISTSMKLKTDLQNIVKHFLLRRTKQDVLESVVPPKTDSVLYCELTTLQKDLYRSILTKNSDIFGKNNSKKNRLLNVLMQLRKCVDHPYLFDGIEPEPFVMGEHLINASGKLHLLDVILKKAYKENHKVLIFSQMTRMLDILQDYISFRNYSYERLDGSVRGEERFAAIKEYQENNNTFVFLLSTKAGGVGLNLTAADTVILYDSDFNPQNDAQAAARCHRIGQTRPVKIVRLISKNTVEEIILRRSERKLKLTEAVVDPESNDDIDILKFGLEKLFSSDNNPTIINDEIEAILGKSENGKWILDSVANENKNNNNLVKVESIYSFEGRDYSTQDQRVLDVLIKDVEKEKISRKNSIDMMPLRPRKQLTEEEKESRRIKRQENLKERELKLKADKLKKKMNLWEKNDYKSLNESEGDSNDDNVSNSSNEDTDVENDEDLKINYEVGDVCEARENTIILQTADNSGDWGYGGVFSAISKNWCKVETAYELSYKMKDLHLGDCHIICVDEKKNIFVGLLICQDRRDKTLKIDNLEICLKRLAKFVKKNVNKVTVRLPRIGYKTPSFNWYAAERLLRKYLILKDIKTVVYYFARREKRRLTLKRNRSNSCDSSSSSSSPTMTTTTSLSNISSEKKIKSNLSLSGLFFYLHNLEEKSRINLTKQLVRLDADVQTTVEDSTDFVVFEKKETVLSNLKELVDGFDNVKIVELIWLEKCIERDELIDYKPYSLS